VAATNSQRQYAAQVLRRLRAAYPDAKCSLDFQSPLQLLVATILSAQCTDERVNRVTPGLFAKYPTAADFARAGLAALKEDVKSTGFFNNKAKNIQACCDAIDRQYHGAVPKELDELVELPGIGRKTANVVLGAAYGIASGIAVDTHVARVSRRLGLTRQTHAEKIEEDLMACIPKKEWISFSHRTIGHGRRVCVARKPKCGECVLNDICPRIGVET